MSGVPLAAVTVSASFVVLPILLAGMLVALLRLLRGPSPHDRALALDLLSMLAAGFVLVYAIAFDQPVLVDVAIVLVLVSFLATVGFARHLGARPGRKE